MLSTIRRSELRRPVSASTMPLMSTEPSADDIAWCQAFLAEAKRLGEYEDGGDLWEFMHQLAADPELRRLPGSKAAQRFLKVPED